MSSAQPPATASAADFLFQAPTPDLPLWPAEEDQSFAQTMAQLSAESPPAAGPAALGAERTGVMAKPALVSAPALAGEVVTLAPASATNEPPRLAREEPEEDVPQTLTNGALLSMFPPIAPPSGAMNRTAEHCSPPLETDTSGPSNARRSDRQVQGVSGRTMDRGIPSPTGGEGQDGPADHGKSTEVPVLPSDRLAGHEPMAGAQRDAAPTRSRDGCAAGERLVKSPPPGTLSTLGERDEVRGPLRLMETFPPALEHRDPVGAPTSSRLAAPITAQSQTEPGASNLQLVQSAQGFKTAPDGHEPGHSRTSILDTLSPAEGENSPNNFVHCTSEPPAHPASGHPLPHRGRGQGEEAVGDSEVHGEPPPPTMEAHWDHETVLRNPLTRPSGTFSPIGGEGRGEATVHGKGRGQEATDHGKSVASLMLHSDRLAGHEPMAGAQASWPAGSPGVLARLPVARRDAASTGSPDGGATDERFVESPDLPALANQEPILDDALTCRDGTLSPSDEERDGARVPSALPRFMGRGPLRLMEISPPPALEDHDPIGVPTSSRPAAPITAQSQPEVGPPNLRFVASSQDLKAAQDGYEPIHSRTSTLPLNRSAEQCPAQLEPDPFGPSNARRSGQQVQGFNVRTIDRGTLSTGGEERGEGATDHSISTASPVLPSDRLASHEPMAVAQASSPAGSPGVVARLPVARRDAAPTRSQEVGATGERFVGSADLSLPTPEAHDPIGVPTSSRLAALIPPQSRPKAGAPVNRSAEHCSAQLEPDRFGSSNAWRSVQPVCAAPAHNSGREAKANTAPALDAQGGGEELTTESESSQPFSRQDAARSSPGNTALPGRSNLVPLRPPAVELKVASAPTSASPSEASPPGQRYEPSQSAASVASPAAEVVAADQAAGESTGAARALNGWMTPVPVTPADRLPFVSPRTAAPEAVAVNNAAPETAGRREPNTTMPLDAVVNVDAPPIDPPAAAVERIAHLAPMAEPSRRVSGGRTSFTMSRSISTQVSANANDGTLVAQQDTRMRATGQTNKIAASSEQKLPMDGAPVWVTPKEPVATGLSKARESIRASRSKGRTAEPGEVALATASLPALSAPDRSTAVHASDSANTSPARLGELETLLVQQVADLKLVGADSMEVRIKPDSRTELALQLHLQDGAVKVHAQIEQGDFGMLNRQWSQLQQTLSAQGIWLGPLRESSAASTVPNLSLAGSLPQSHPDPGSRRQRPSTPDSLDDLPLVGSVTEPLHRRRGRPAAVTGSRWEFWA